MPVRTTTSQWTAAPVPPPPRQPRHVPTPPLPPPPPRQHHLLPSGRARTSFSMGEHTQLGCLERGSTKEPGPVFYLWLSKVSANERRHYICNVFSHWPKPCSTIDTFNERASVNELTLEVHLITIAVSLQNFVGGCKIAKIVAVKHIFSELFLPILPCNPFLNVIVKPHYCGP